VNEVYQQKDKLWVVWAYKSIVKQDIATFFRMW